MGTDVDREIGKRIKNRRESLEMSQDALAKKLGYTSRSTVNKIDNGVNSLRQTKIAAIAKALETTPAELMGWSEEEQTDPYYTDEKTRETAQAIFENEELRMLFDAAKDASVEDLQTVHQMLLALKRKEQSNDI